MKQTLQAAEIELIRFGQNSILTVSNPDPTDNEMNMHSFDPIDDDSLEDH